MSCHKVLILISLCAYVCGERNETEEFRPLDDRVGPIIEKYLKVEESTSAFGRFVKTLEDLFGEAAVKRKQTEILRLVRGLLHKYDNYNVTRGIELKRIDDDDGENGIQDEDIFESLVGYAKHHVIKVHFSELIDDVSEKVKRSSQDITYSGRFGGGKNAFLTGFGLGFLAFGLKKLMVPFMIGAQIVKSVLIAMFLPSIIGGIGKLVGKGVSGFATASNGFGHSNNMMHGQMEDFEFKDPGSYENQNQNAYPYPDAQPEGSSSVFSYSYPNGQYDYSRLQQSVGVLPAHAQGLTNRYTSNTRLTYMPNNNHHGSFYTKHSDRKKQSYKIFHNIPSSSLLLTNYDPFYSPLLSRMDSVFKQLGYETEGCRERLICLMYKNPAKFAPYSNLISAQLSRELNELRKPSTDNPDILRFFKYMKAAKDGQDGMDCIRIYSSCFDSRETISPPMVKTYNEINKLVHARKLTK